MTDQPPPQFLLLGPLDVRFDGASIALGGLRQRALLALLLLHPGEAVSRDRLIDDLWGEQPPERAANALAALVARLRRLLPPDTVATEPGGYSIHVDLDEIDLFRFERLRQDGDTALAAGDPMLAATLLRSALALWRGPPLDDFRYQAFAESAIRRLEELRLTVLESRLEADLAAGRHHELVGELQSLVLEHPLRERPRAQLMEALARSGRQAEALEVYRETRRFLNEELGLEPTMRLRDLHQAILRQDDDVHARSLRSSKERRVVTVALVDLVGFARLSNDLQPEQIEAMLEPWRVRVCEEVERHGGTIEGFSGDGAMAIFGAPTIHEDDPERAVCAALAIRDWARNESVELRVGVMTGDALITFDAASGIRAIGHFIGTAAALLRVASPGSVLVGEVTFRATQQAITYRPHEPVKPIAEGAPLAAWEAVDRAAVSRAARDPHVAR
jgi:DNA-binding SARP family transcriptional activator